MNNDQNENTSVGEIHYRKIRTFDLLFQLTNSQKIATSLFAGGCAGNEHFVFNRIILILLQVRLRKQQLHHLIERRLISKVNKKKIFFQFQSFF
jgi:hypothetical protein